ncbi:hypothetical protein [Pseudomonas sp. NFX224]
MELGTVLANFGEMFPNASNRQQILWEALKRNTQINPLTKQ